MFMLPAPLRKLKETCWNTVSNLLQTKLIKNSQTNKETTLDTPSKATVIEKIKIKKKIKNGFYQDSC